MLQLTTIVFLIAFSLLALIYNIAVELYLFWHIWWLDMPVHFFGGTVVALGLYTLRDFRLYPNKYLKPLIVVVLVLFVALVWEAYEVIIGVPVEADYVTDTVIDVILGLFGGILGYVIGNSLRNLNQ